MTEDIDKISFAYDIMSRAMSPFATLLWPLLSVLLPTSDNFVILASLRCPSVCLSVCLCSITRKVLHTEYVKKIITFG